MAKTTKRYDFTGPPGVVEKFKRVAGSRRFSSTIVEMMEERIRSKTPPAKGKPGSGGA